MLQFHVGVGLIGILSGLVVLYGLLIGKPYGAWTAVFLVTTILTSVTGFPLPPYGFDPPRAVGVISHVRQVQEVIPNGFYVRKDPRGSRIETRGEAA